MADAAVLRAGAGAGVELIRLNRPGKRNALDSATLGAFIAELEDLGRDAAVRALVISTTDVRALCAGADLGEQLDRDAGLARMAAFCRLYALLEEFPVPTVAVCVGNCVGAGAEIAAGCDLRVAGDNLHLSWAGARLGVPVGPARLVPLVGLAAAKDLLLTGRPVGVDEAQQLGLVHRTAPAEQAETVAVRLAGEVAAQPPEGVRTIKRMLRELESTAARVAYENDALMQFQFHGAGLPGTGRSPA